MKEVFTLNPYKQVLLSEKDYQKLAEMANANQELIEQKAKELYHEKGTASLSVTLRLQDGLNNREYESIRISDPMLSQATELGSIPKERVAEINAAVREMLVDFYKEYQLPVDEARKAYKKMTSRSRFQLNIACLVIVFGVLCGLLQSVVFNLLK